MDIKDMDGNVVGYQEDSVKTWPYTLEKDGLTWFWTLWETDNAVSCCSGAAMTKWGAMWAMERIKKKEMKRRFSTVRGHLNG